MASTTAAHPETKHPVIQHAGEEVSNELRTRLAAVEPACLRTFTPSLVVMGKSQGCYHFTPEGRKLADFTSGVLVANLGHHPTRWWQRVWNYLGLAGASLASVSAGDNEFLAGVPLTAYNGLTELEVLASERLVANMRNQPGGNRMEQVLWSASGSEAIQKALWAALARRPGADIILATRTGFHGKKGLAGAVTGSEKDPERDSRVRFIAFPTAECVNVERRRQPLDMKPYEAEWQQMFAEYGSRICAVITEPYLGGGGSFHPQPEYLQRLQAWCRQHDILFILDEVQANFGRTGSMYAYTTYGLEPDLVVLGKGLGNGVAVSAAVGAASLFAHLPFGQSSDTWSGNPLSCAAVLATLDEFETTPVLDHAQQLAVLIEEWLLQMQNELDIVAHVRGEGIVWGIECAPLGTHSGADSANACIAACYHGDEQHRAIHLLGALAGKVIRISPPLVMPLDEAREYLSVLYQLFAQAQQELLRD